MPAGRHGTLVGVTEEARIGATRGHRPAAGDFLPVLEGMRACAAIGVVVTHVAFQTGHTDGLAGRLFGLGFTPQDQAFGGAFYTLTGFHGAHVLVGLTLLTFCFIRIKRANDFTVARHAPLAASSVYWHFVDVVWILLYILVYLI